MWEIYAYQNADSLFGVFNAAAAIHASGDYLSAVSACPADGIPQVQKTVRYICKKKGGEGAVREIADLILAAQQQ